METTKDIDYQNGEVNKKQLQQEVNRFNLDKASEASALVMSFLP